ncbi:MAG: hypothetical protein J07HN4v3_00433, partial [Halonotius sp. J07HN4]
SETVQVVAYATAPCALAWLPFPMVRTACVLYGVALLIGGIRVVHATTLLRATVAAALPATLVFGVAYGGLWAGETATVLAG